MIRRETLHQYHKDHRKVFVTIEDGDYGSIHEWVEIVSPKMDDNFWTIKDSSGETHTIHRMYIHTEEVPRGTNLWEA